MDVLEVVRKEINQHQLLKAGAKIVVGVSGGGDSLCLLHVLRRLTAEFGWSLHVAHLNHCLRGAESDQDMVSVALLTMEWGLPCAIEAVDVATLARQHRLSVEETARQVRYGFLADVARRVKANAVAVGHHADDQSETVLMHFLRGAGVAGLKGMLPTIELGKLITIGDASASPSTTPIQLVRPMLSVTRGEIEAYCQAHGLTPRFDRSNLDTTYFRNRLRHHLLPILEAYNPNIRALVRRTAALAAADYELLMTVLDDAWAKVVKEENQDAVAFDLQGWRALPLSLKRATLRTAANRLRPHLRDVDFLHIENAVGVATNGSTGAQATLPGGLCVTVGYETLRLAILGENGPFPDGPLLWQEALIPVAIPGRTPLPGKRMTGEPRASHQDTRDTGGSSRWCLEAHRWDGARDTVTTNRDRWTAYLDADRLGPHPGLRTRRPGDRFRPLGMGTHSVDVADFMINAKIPARWRSHIPLLVHDRPGSTGAEEIAWLVGWRIDERVKVMAKTRHILRLRWLTSDTKEGSDG